MYLKLRNGIVRRNIEIFRIILKRASHLAANSQTEKTEHVFKVFIHKAKGEVRFSDLSSDPLDSRDWVVAFFYLSLPETSKQEISFDISGSDRTFFSWDGFELEALTSLRETVKTIQLMTKFLPRLKSIASTLKEFSQINLDSFLDEMPTKDLIHEAWHQISRENCEYLLGSQDPGTFLFRQDEFAAILEAQLIRAHKEAISCITLTYINNFQKVVDLTLVKKKEGWIIYNNDPSLENPIYPSARALLDSLRRVLKKPLLNF